MKVVRNGHTWRHQTLNRSPLFQPSIQLHLAYKWLLYVRGPAKKLVQCESKRIKTFGLTIWCKFWRERKKRIPAWNQTWELSISSLTCLPLSHWTHGREAEANLLISARLEALADSSCLSLSHSCLLWMEICGQGCGLTVYKHIA